MIDIFSNNKYFKITKDKLIEELLYLKNTFHFNTLQDCFGLQSSGECVVYYQLFSEKLNKVIFLFTTGLNIPTITNIFKNANWYEREIFEQFGLKFAGHNNIKKLMLDN